MSELLARLCATENLRRAPKILLLAAHPDDEVIGAGALLARLPQATLVHATDGAPRAMNDAYRAGFTTRRSYATVRRQELCQALALIGIAPAQTRRLGYADQEVSLALVAFTQQLLGLLERLRPEVLLTHAYEGGHPDHDAVAFAAQAACRLLAKQASDAPTRIEFASYHARAGRVRRGAFLSRADCPEMAVVLTRAERALKQRLFACFVSQAAVLGDFTIAHERFRCAPRYDFTAPPHAGQLNYERFAWGWTGARWRALARGALIELDLCSEREPEA